MKKILIQLIKFGIVGVISTVVDLVVYGILANGFGIYQVTATVAGFLISLIVNYLLSMKYVFESRDDISKKREFITYAILSGIGLGIDALMVYLLLDLWYPNNPALVAMVPQDWANIIGKCLATGVVMIFNFVTRKIFLEKKD